MTLQASGKPCSAPMVSRPDLALLGGHEHHQDLAATQLTFDFQHGMRLGSFVERLD